MLALPDPILLVTVGVDVQERYLAQLIMGWTHESECWVLDWSTIEGDPRDPALLRSTLHDLSELRYPARGLPVHLIGVDSGFCTSHVYHAVQTAPRRGGKWVYPTKGVGGRIGDPIVLATDMRDRDRRRGLRPLCINTDAAKQELAAQLAIATPGRGYVHIPKRVGTDFVKQLTAEQERTKYDDDGVVVGTKWEKRTPDARNEALDCACICLALFHLVRKQHWLHFLQERYGADDGLRRWQVQYPGERMWRPPVRRNHIEPFAVAHGSARRWLERRQ